MGCCVIMGCCNTGCCVIMGYCWGMQYPMFACWFQFGICCVCPRAQISTPVTPRVDGTMLRSDFFWIASRVHMCSGVSFVSHALRGALVAIVPGVVSVGPIIFCGFVAP